MKAKLLGGMATILCGVKKQEESPAKYPLPKTHRQPLQPMNLNIMSSAPASPLHAVTSSDCNTPNAASYSSRVSLSSVGSVASNSCSDISPYIDSFDVIDSVFSETSGLETSLAKAVSASINVDDNELSSENDNIEEMAGSLPPMRSFLGF